ncbi:MAG: NAD(P)-binding domain-containing protein [Pseudomonadota bacterium]
MGPLELIIGSAALAIFAILVWTVISIRVALLRMRTLRQDFEHSQAMGAQPASLHPRINLDKCIGTDACVAACPETNVIGIVDGQARLANPTACIGHGECLRACPVGAIELVIGSETRGVDIPELDFGFETNVPGLFIVGELGGMGLIYNAMTQALTCMARLTKSLPKPVEDVHQVLIVGAGPAGLAASLAAIEAGLDYVTIDQESMGGTVLQYPRQKIVMTRAVRLPVYGQIKLSTVKKEDLLELWEDIVAKAGVQVQGGVQLTALRRDEDGCFTAGTLRDGQAGEVRAQRVVLALGRRGTPRKLEIPGEEFSKVTYRLLEPENYAGTKTLVVGGGDSAVEAAIALGEAGATVHLAHRRRVFDRIKIKNQKRLDGAVEAGLVSLLLEASPRSIMESEVEIKVGEDTRRIDNDYVLIFAGGLLPTKLLEDAGVSVRKYHGEVYAPAN